MFRALFRLSRSAPADPTEQWAKSVGRSTFFPWSLKNPWQSKSVTPNAPRLLSARRNGSICDAATVFDAAALARGRCVAIDGSGGLPSNQADGQVTQTATDEAAGLPCAVRVAGRSGTRADERRAERAAERRADVAADGAAHRAADGHAVISTHDDAAADADARARTYACTDNGPHGGPFLGAVVDADRGAQREPDYNKGADARRRRRDRVVRLPGQKELRPAADEPVVVLRRARGPRAMSGRVRPGLRRVVCAAAAARLQNRGRRAARPRARQAAAAGGAVPGRGVPVGVMSSFVVSCLPSESSFLDPRRSA